MIRGMKRIAIFLVLVLAATLSACNSVNMKPHSLDKSETVYAWYGGYHMRHAVKAELESRGYKVVVGKLKGETFAERNDDDIVISKEDAMGARYILRTRERGKSFAPILCAFGGFYWWTFDVSISDQKTGEELLSWTGRGCANGNLARLEKIMDKIEK